ncbi:MAG: HDIG domain-containing protein [Flavobacteriales bacterium]|jgi:putative nucleotidyltransferase with HDIG domain|nr:HDIG domain-containing protein [Flavobacteriales bacterium]
MKKILTFLATKQNLVTKIFILGFSILILTFLLPREIRFKYEFQENKPWQHENLYADFAFSVERNSKELEAERTSIKKEAKQYFSKNDQVKKEKIDAFLLWWQTNYEQITSLDSIPENAPQILAFKELKEVGVKYFEKVYSKGVISNKASTTGTVWVNDDHKVKRFDPKKYYSLSSALAELKTVQTVHFENSELPEILVPYILPNIVFDEALTNKHLNQILIKIPQFKDYTEPGSLIVSKGQVVDANLLQKLESYQKEFEKKNTNNVNIALLFLGQLLVISLSLILLFIFIGQFYKEILIQNNNLLFIYLSIIVMTISTKMVMDFAPEWVFAIPFCLLPLILKSFYETRLALFVHIIATLIIGFVVANSFQFVFLQLIGGITSILTVQSLYRRSDLFLSAVKIIVVYLVSYISIELLQSTSWSSLELFPLVLLAISGMLTIIAYPLVYGIEKVFGLVSDISLLELTDTNNPLLKELQEKAPGTFQHSLQVANLAESAISDIGGNSLLVRAGALYHDIGKMKNPRFFIENQNTSVNPHDEMDFNQSAKIIIDHVIDGIELAKKYKLPERIIDFIRTHHGDSTVQYFYRMYLKNFPEGELTEEAFRYPGPKPFSKETAVLMMADSVEAASKSIQSPDVQKINALVDKILDNQMLEGQFNNSDINLREIEQIKKVFKNKLRNIYHLRIEYPD